MKKLLCLVMILALLLCCGVNIASADSLTEYSPFLYFASDKKLHINDDNISVDDIPTLVNGEYIIMTHAGLLSLRNYAFNDLIVKVDGDVKTTVPQIQGSNPSAYVFNLSAPTLLEFNEIKIDNASSNPNEVTYIIEFTTLQTDFLKITVNPAVQPQASYSNFNVTIEGAADVEFDFDTAADDKLVGFYYVGAQAIPIVFGPSGTANLYNNASAYNITANANGLSLLNTLPVSDNSIHFSIYPYVGMPLKYYGISKTAYIVSSLSADFSVTAGTGGNTSVPSTGDSTPVALYASLALCCLAVIAVLLIRRRRA